MGRLPVFEKKAGRNKPLVMHMQIFVKRFKRLDIARQNLLKTRPERGKIVDDIRHLRQHPEARLTIT